jgi:hypothetical protein
MPSSGLKITSPCSAWKARRRAFRRGDQGRRGELAELADRQLFVVVADRRRLVEHARALLFRQFQQVGAVDVFHVEGRILALDDGVEFGQAQVDACLLARIGAVPGRPVAGQGDARHVGADHAPPSSAMSRCSNA